MNYEDFAARVRGANLEPRRCSDIHWQIRGGRKMVNVWPNTKRGFRFQASGKGARSGHLEDAIQAAEPGIKISNVKRGST